MLLSDLPFIDDVKKGERYLEREIFCCVGHLYFCCGHVSFVLCTYVMYETYFLIYDMT